MKLLIVDQCGVGLSLALRANIAGHQVRWFVKGDKSVGLGFSGIERVDNWVSSVPWADLIVSASGTDYIERLAFFAKRGHPVFAPSPESIKLNKAAEGTPGVEMRVGRALGSKGWVGQWSEGFHYSKLMSGGYGPETDGMGAVGYFTETSKLGAETLAKMEKTLLEAGHRGHVMLTARVAENGKVTPTGLTCGMDWPTASMMLGATQGDPVQWMKDALDGKDTTSFSEDIGCCVVLAHADFPHCNAPKEATHGAPIRGVTRGNKQHIHPRCVQAEEEKAAWVTAGPCVAVITGYGKSVSQSTKRAYGTIGKLSLKGAILRDDIGENLKKTLPALQEHGYALACSYA